MSISRQVFNVAIIYLSLVSQYSENVMERTIEKRQNNLTEMHLPSRLPSVDGFIATRECSEIGNIWWAVNPVTGQWESFLVSDCARRDNSDGTRTWMQENNIAFEVDYLTAVRWQTVGRLTKTEWSKECLIGKVRLEP